ncbi:MAG: HEAT repeat domain-containing protein [Chloroflexota bacterium]
MIEQDQFLRDALRDADPQVRLNAAVRLAYLGSAAGLGDLLAGLDHESSSISFIQVPDTLALLGDAGREPLRRLVSRPGPARIAAARALVLRGQFDGVQAAVTDALRDPPTRWMATVLAGEIGPRAADAAEALERAIREAGGDLPIGLPALVSIAGERALPFLIEQLTHASTEMRAAAMRALAGLGPAAATVATALVGSVRDGALPLRERLAAAHALTRVGSSADAAAASLCAILPDADRWLQVGLLRSLAQLCPDYPLQPESSPYHWPRWEAQLLYAASPRPVERFQPALLTLLIDYLDHEDDDVRRNAALALAFFGDSGRSAASTVRRSAGLPPHLRHDLLHRLGEPSALDLTGFPWDVAMTQPEIDLDAVAGPCERLWAQAHSEPLDDALPVEKWVFLRYLVERRGFLLHGSRTPGLDLLQPISRSGGGNRTSDQPGVFAVDHALMAMYFGVVARTRVPSLSNALYERRWPDGSSRRCFHLGAEFVALAARPFIDATVYVLAPDTFSMLNEWTSLVPVRPLARVAVAPADFPLLEYLWGSDLGPLASQFSDDFPFLQDVGWWATKRSALSARA